MLGPDDVGHRVVVRRIVGVRDDRPVFTDILGDLVDFGAGELTVRTRKGLVTVPLAAVVAGKRIPPPPPRRSPRHPPAG